jgi:MoaA/NifB/PqqE/SkfB family radical SAM enzyme/ubiquinone/menaquinone biosynthesis C-methylase UbiE
MTLPPWQRFAVNKSPVYVLPDQPDWFIPSAKAEPIVEALLAGKDPVSLAEKRLASQLERPIASVYKGRAAHLQLQSLKECWFHITNHCNLSCEHCLFSAGPSCRESLSRSVLDQGVSEAYGLGCRLFLFTGGEPFIYPGFLEVVQTILADPASHVVILTNGLLLEKHMEAITSLDTTRLHLQISVDGMQESHDAMRGTGAFERLETNLQLVRQAGLQVTLSMAVCRTNLHDMAELVRFAKNHGASHVHFLYHFVRGKGTASEHVAPGEIVPRLLQAAALAEELGVVIDNIEALRSQVFSTPGTHFDLSNTGWESLAVGPDGHIYPSPALVGIADLDCGLLSDGLETVWRASPVLNDIRDATLYGSAYDANPLKYIVGGGDIDHSYMTGGVFVGADPYVEIYNQVALWLIRRQGTHYHTHDLPEIALKMGDVRFDCAEGSEVSLTHCNCVAGLADDHGHGSVREFYTRAALSANTDIVNPFGAGQAEVDFIPEVAKKRSYGCGSPVLDGAPVWGETVVDLGSGSGVECFIAAEKVGESGRVIGVDMTDDMLDLARSSMAQVSGRLGYENVEFKQGFLEAIPLADETADLMISNCVINLSPDKRKTFQEIMRVLKPGGRLLVSDIVTDLPIPVIIKNDEQFRGECLGGAMLQEDLMAMLRGAGFTSMELIKRFPYRKVESTQFYSLTFRAWKPDVPQWVELIYRGPFGAVYTESGALLLKGKRTRLRLADVKGLGDSVFVVDAEGGVTNMDMVSSCCAPQTDIAPMASCCTTGPEASCCETIPESPCCAAEEPRLDKGCMVCGRVLAYDTKPSPAACHYCHTEVKTNVTCEAGHFVCDKCHQKEGLAIIRQICLQTAKTDMLELLVEIRNHQAIPMHGPEHHAMLPGIILAVAKNSGLSVTRGDILTGIERGSKVPGGSCGFMGTCGAATGVGIGFAVLFKATPLTPLARQKAQFATARVLTAIAGLPAGRCCQRESYMALQEVAKLSAELLEQPLRGGGALICAQYGDNRECVGRQCPLWATRKQGAVAPVTLPMY